MPISLGDDAFHQKQDFNQWAEDIFKISCDKFLVDFSHVPKHLISVENLMLTEKNVRLQPVCGSYDRDSLEELLSFFHNKNIYSCVLKNKPINLLRNTEHVCVLLEICIDGVIHFFECKYLNKINFLDSIERNQLRTG